MTLIIGDIHGCYDELQALLDKAGTGDDEPIIALGDVVDRGPASPQTLLFLQQRPLTQVLTGNHERKHVRQMLHRLRQRQAIETIVAEALRSPAEALAVWSYLAPDEQTEL